MDIMGEPRPPSRCGESGATLNRDPSRLRGNSPRGSEGPLLPRDVEDVLPPPRRHADALDGCESGLGADVLVVVPGPIDGVADSGGLEAGAGGVADDEEVVLD